MGPPFCCLNVCMKKETVLFRFNEHQKKNGVQEYSVQVVLPGTYSKDVIGATQDELLEGIDQALESLFTILGIPTSVVRSVGPDSKEYVFRDQSGDVVPKGPFAGTAKATFKAEVYRNGVAIPLEEDRNI